MASPTLVKRRRPGPVLVCRKCLKRSDDSKGIKKAIKRQARQAAAVSAKPPRVVMTSCFGLCPKRAVVITGGVGAACGEYALVSSPRDVAGALRLLQLDPGSSS